MTARTIRRKSTQTFEQGDFCHVDRREQGRRPTLLRGTSGTDNLALADELLSPGFRFYFAGSPDPMDLQSYKGFLAARRGAFPTAVS
jgi:hypothetical protein